MTAFALAVDAQFDDPNLGIDARWQAAATGEVTVVRIRRRIPDTIVGLGGANRLDLPAMLISVRLSEVPEPAAGDRVEILDDGGAVVERLEVAALAGIDARRLVRTCEVAPVPGEDAP